MLDVLVLVFIYFIYCFVSLKLVISQYVSIIIRLVVSQQVLEISKLNKFNNSDLFMLGLIFMLIVLLAQ